MAVKIWVPRTLDQLLIKLSDHFHESKTRCLRQILFKYAYGQVQLEKFRSVAIQGAGDPEADPDRPLYSRTSASDPYATPELGKCGEDIKLWIPQKLRDDLQILADRASVPLSQFIREILVSELLGHVYLPERRSLVEGEGPTEKNPPSA
ncbi:MAG TPA: hypothetical protein PKO06_17680 [Candidatus Ozemobacteraceae bacterium]|nr:hypothetical protein [Candidatus Ozemobacteraceae bacterium]